MKKLLSILLLIFLNMPNIFAYDEIYGGLKPLERQVLTLGNNTCKDIQESDIPTIFIPGILASWYSEEGFEKSNVKRWIPDPITHVYDTLFNTFYLNGYGLKDVYYKGEFETYIKGNPKNSLYLFGYDWKKDNKVTAKLLSNLILQIRKKYEEENLCDIGTVNIVAHSMGGLVARSMLEDMCVSDKDLKNYNYRGDLKRGELKDFVNYPCNNFTKINKLVTIGTPQRGSPKTLALWEKGDIDSIEKFFVGTPLKLQLGILSDEELYRIIHGYNNNLMNGIVTIGQLLPDIINSNIYNNSLKYLYKNSTKEVSMGENFDNLNKKYYIDNYAYPQNSFLEELNSNKNIEKMFKNISGKYTLYYSNITGNLDKNNIIEFDISDKYKTLYNGYKYVTENIHEDNTYLMKEKDVYDIYSNYDEYKKRQNNKFYNYGNIVRDEKGNGGDGTVPSKNSRLVPNDLYNTNEIPKSKKFESIEIDCFNNDGGENNIAMKLGKAEGGLCAHSQLPIMTAVIVYNEISQKNIFIGLKDSEKIIKERDLLYSYLGHVNYEVTKYGFFKEYKFPIDGSITKDSNSKQVGISNDTEINKLFTNNFQPFFYKLNDKDNPINSNTESIYKGINVDEFINDRYNDNYDRKDLDFSGEVGAINSILRYEILSPINIIIEDELGRKIGIDPDTGMIINEIPGAWTSGDTEGSNEPEFFLIPKTGTGQVSHKIHTYGTGDGEYHIVMNEIKTDESMSGTEASLTIAGVAKKGEEEGYIVGIKGSKAGFTKVKVDDLNTSKETDLEEKYKDILEKLYSIIDGKYSQNAKDKLKEKLVKFQLNKNSKFKDNEKVNYLIGKLVEYLK